MKKKSWTKKFRRRILYLYCKRFCLENCPSFDWTWQMNTNDNKIETNLISQNIFQTLFNEERPDLFASQISYQSSCCCCFLFFSLFIHRVQPVAFDWLSLVYPWPIGYCREFCQSIIILSICSVLLVHFSNNDRFDW